MDKKASLKKLDQKLRRDCKLPLRESNVVFGEGSVYPKAMFIGEAPGKRENETGRPFVGAAGKLLDKLLASIGWNREEVYITSVLKRRPPGNRDPKPAEIAAYAPYLSEQIEILDPPALVTLGRFALNYFLPEAHMTASQGKLYRAGNRLIIPLFHPAAAFHSAAAARAIRESFKRLPELVCAGKKP